MWLENQNKLVVTWELTEQVHIFSDFILKEILRLYGQIPTILKSIRHCECINITLLYW